MKNRGMIWGTTEKEMKLVNPDVTFIAVVDRASGWTEEAKTYDDAIQILRDLVESDGHHIFLRADGWRTSPGSFKSIHSIITWFDTQTNKTYSKTIRANGIDCQMIVDYQAKCLKYLRENYQERFQYKK